MADLRRSSENRSSVKAIRSLSAPSYQVRSNRTCFLRKVFAVNNDDLASLSRPPMGEASQTVTGQNKSAAKLAQKQVNLWFRERKYIMEKLDRAEDEIYQRLISIERTKMLIEKARDASPDRSSASLYIGRHIDARSKQNSRGDVSKSANAINLQAVIDEETAKTAGAGDVSGSVEQTGAAASNSASPRAKFEDGISRTGTSTARGFEAAKRINLEALKEDENEATTTAVDPKQTTQPPVSVRPTTQANVSSRGQQQQLLLQQSDRAKTDLGLAEEKQEDAKMTPAVDDTKASNQEPPNKVNSNISKVKSRPSKQKSSATPQNNTANVLVPTKSEQEPKTNARKIEEKILNEPFTYWTRSGSGKLIPSDIPYRRREFPLPEERDDETRLRDLLNSERKTKNDSMRKFRHLCTDIDKLGKINNEYFKYPLHLLWFSCYNVLVEEWNPLDEARKMLALQQMSKKDEEDAQERWKKLGMMR